MPVNDTSSPVVLEEVEGIQRRAALTPVVLRPLKRSGGRTSPIPAHVRVNGVSLSDDDHAYILRKLGMKLGKFTSSIERVSVRVRDVNGPRGGVDQECSVKVVVSGLPSVVVTRSQAAMQGAIDQALHAIERAVRRTVGRRRLKPLHRRGPRRVLASVRAGVSSHAGVSAHG